MPRIHHLSTEEIALCADAVMEEKPATLLGDLVEHVEKCFACKKEIMRCLFLVELRSILRQSYRSSRRVRRGEVLNAVVGMSEVILWQLS